MQNTSELAEATSSEDPRVGLAAVVALRTLLESLEELQVENARNKGWSWQQIADALGVSKQAVHKKHSGERRTVRRTHGLPGRARRTGGRTRSTGLESPRAAEEPQRKEWVLRNDRRPVRAGTQGWSCRGEGCGPWVTSD